MVAKPLGLVVHFLHSKKNKREANGLCDETTQLPPRFVLNSSLDWRRWLETSFGHDSLLRSMMYTSSSTGVVQSLQAKAPKSRFERRNQRLTADRSR